MFRSFGGERIFWICVCQREKGNWNVESFILRYWALQKALVLGLYWEVVYLPLQSSGVERNTYRMRGTASLITGDRCIYILCDSSIMLVELLDRKVLVFRIGVHVHWPGLHPYASIRPLAFTPWTPTGWYLAHMKFHLGSVETWMAKRSDQKKQFLELYVIRFDVQFHTELNKIWEKRTLPWNQEEEKSGRFLQKKKITIYSARIAIYKPRTPMHGSIHKKRG